MCNLNECPTDMALAKQLCDGKSSDSFIRLCGDDASCTAKILTDNNAVWHASCKSKIKREKVERLQSKKRKDLSADNASPVDTRRSDDGQDSSEKSPKCFLCNNEKHIKSTVHKAATLNLDSKVRWCAIIVGDKEVIGKLSSVDLIGLDAMYHLTCLTDLYRRADNKVKEESPESKASTIAKA